MNSISSTHTGIGTKCDLDEEMQFFLKNIPQGIIDKVLTHQFYPAKDIEFLKPANQKLETRKIFGPLLYDELESTPERKVMLLACMYFHCKNLDRPEKPHLFDYFAKIPNIGIIDHTLTYNDKLQGDEFVFRDEPWYQNLQKNGGYKEFRSRLFDYETCELLVGFGYKRIQRPELDAIIVYFNNRKAAHFGKVVEIKENGDVFIESKFAIFYTYRHRIDLIPVFFGNEYAFFRGPEKRGENDLSHDSH